MKKLAAAIVALFTLSALPLFAGDVTVKGVHLCCGSCVDGVEAALADVKGVSGLACDRNTKVVAFKAADADTAKKAIEALAEAGFYGTAKHGKDEIAFPDSGAKKETKADKVTLVGLHLCCGSCVKDAHASLKGITQASKIDIDRETRTVTIVGSDIVVSEAVAALNKGGFYGKVSE